MQSLTRCRPTRLGISILMLAVLLVAPGCAYWNKFKLGGGKEKTVTVPSLESLIKAVGAPIKDRTKDGVYLLELNSRSGPLPLVVGWESANKNYLKMKLTLINKKPGYIFPGPVLKYLNNLNLEYDHLKFLADDEFGDIDLGYLIDYRLLDAVSFRNALEMLLAVANDEIDELARAVGKSGEEGVILWPPPKK